MGMALPTEITIFFGLILGLMTSFHCVGMCGPIALALPLSGDTKAKKLLGAVLYNLGRTVTYAAMGGIFGLVGQGLSTLGFQRWVSIITGTIMIATVFFPSIFSFKLDVDKGMYSIVGRLRAILKKLFSTKSMGSLFLIGLLNGLLPCGPLYAAVIISAGTGSAIGSITFMTLFGLGTIPLLFAVTILGNFISEGIRNKINNLIPVVIVIMGILFILRGLALGIPFVSPSQKKLEKVIDKVEQKMENRTLDSTNCKTGRDTIRTSCCKD